MEKIKRNKVFMSFWLFSSVIVLFELVVFLAFFLGIIISMGFLAVKGIMIGGMSYTLCIISFLLFFLCVSINRGNRLLLILSLVILLGAFAVKYYTSTTNHSIQQKSTDMTVHKLPSIYNSLMFNNNKKSEQHQSLKFVDSFNSALNGNWLIQNFSFSENGCEMNGSQVNVGNSLLTLSVDLNENNQKPFIGGEIGSCNSFLYGLFTVRMKNQIIPGTVSSFFLMNKWKPEEWEHKEIDIEFIGKNTKAVQFTVHHFKDGGRKHVFNEHTYLLGFDSSADFHDYSIVWNPDSISLLIDGNWIHSVKNILIDEDMYIRMNHWAANPTNIDFTNWLGLIDKTQLPSRSFYDYVKYSPIR